jgi:hypothetical protein
MSPLADRASLFWVRPNVSGFSSAFATSGVYYSLRDAFAGTACSVHAGTIRDGVEAERHEHELLGEQRPDPLGERGSAEEGG